MLRRLLIIVFTTALLSCGKPGQEPVIMTVTGPINPEMMGVTLPHEHIIVDFIGADSTGYHRWNKQEVETKVLPYLEQVRALGLQTLIECTPEYLGRDPVLLKTLSKKSGLNILTCTGYYGAMDNMFIPAPAFTETAEEIAAHWISEWEDGIENTGIKPGFIKIAVARTEPLSELHRKLVRAAAITHIETGLVINSHTGPAAGAFEQLAILAEEGVAPDAFIWTHAHAGSNEERVKFAKLGGWVSIDKVTDSPEQIQIYVDMLLVMKENRVMDHVLISHDAGWYRVGEPGGGNFRDYTAVFTKLVPANAGKWFYRPGYQSIAG